MNYDLIYKHFKLSDINYFGCQICDSLKEDTKSDAYPVFLMVYVYGDDNSLSLSVTKEMVPLSEIKYTHEEVIELIYDKLHTFPVFPIYQFDKDAKSLDFNKGKYQISSTKIEDKLSINRVKNRIAMASRRGIGNANLGRTMMYIGKYHLDRPIILLKDIATDKYAVVFHPHIDKYILNMDYV